MKLKRHIKKILLVIVCIFCIFVLCLFLLSREEVPDRIQYGMSFNTPYALELGLDPRVVYDAFLDELGVRHLRLAAHWDMVESRDDVYNFEELDYQLKRAEEVGAEVVLAVGRRLPRWPECHTPEWAKELSWDEQKEEIKEYITIVVKRYKDNPAITYWQVENEPYLEVFAKEHCGEFDESFLEEEVALVRSLDPGRPIVLTDSGNLGLWSGPYARGDAFGTSVYVYFWNPELGQFETVLPPWAYRVKRNVMELIHGKKEFFLIELSAEPWLLEPIVDVSVETQFNRMNNEKFEKILEYARKTHIEQQYLWGGEWWYWLKEQGHESMWERGKDLFRENMR